LLVHIGDPSSNQATTLESQVIHMIQELFGQTLRTISIASTVTNDCNAEQKRSDRTRSALAGELKFTMMSPMPVSKTTSDPQVRS
jgi:hypothetical protein